MLNGNLNAEGCTKNYKLEQQVQTLTDKLVICRVDETRSANEA